MSQVKNVHVWIVAMILHSLHLDPSFFPPLCSVSLRLSLFPFTLAFPPSPFLPIFPLFLYPYMGKTLLCVGKHLICSSFLITTIIRELKVDSKLKEALFNHWFSFLKAVRCLLSV